MTVEINASQNERIKTGENLPIAAKFISVNVPSDVENAYTTTKMIGAMTKIPIQTIYGIVKSFDFIAFPIHGTQRTASPTILTPKS